MADTERPESLTANPPDPGGVAQLFERKQEDAPAPEEGAGAGITTEITTRGRSVRRGLALEDIARACEAARSVGVTGPAAVVAVEIGGIARATLRAAEDTTWDVAEALLQNALIECFDGVADDPDALDTQLGAQCALIAAKALGRTCVGHPHLAAHYHAWIKQTPRLYKLATAVSPGGVVRCELCGQALQRSAARSVHRRARALFAGLHTVSDALAQTDSEVHVVVDAGSHELYEAITAHFESAEVPRKGGEAWLQRIGEVGDVRVRVYVVRNRAVGGVRHG